MKIISYSLFKGTDPLAEIFYVRGFYFNVLMNTLVYPGWKTVVHVDAYIYSKYKSLFERMHNAYGVESVMCDPCHTHCQKMLWRMMPVFDEQVEYVICRDADALTSQREAKAVEQWVESGLVLHGINDNQAHSIPLLGGMCGFKAAPVRELFGSWDNMLSKSLQPVDKHGSDQVFLNSVLYNSFPGQLAMAMGSCGRNQVFRAAAEWLLKSDQSNPLWTSDLCTSFIGSAGCNEMETLRFLRSKSIHLLEDRNSGLYNEYPDIFYWHKAIQ